MAFCKNCGTQISDEAAFCPNCGTAQRAVTIEADYVPPQDYALDRSQEYVPGPQQDFSRDYQADYTQSYQSNYSQNYQPNYSNYPPPNSAPPVVDNGGFGWGLLGCCIPIVGLILFLVWKGTKPKSSKAAGIGALVGVICVVVLYVLIIAFIIYGAVLTGEY